MSDFLPEPDYESDPSTVTVEIAGEEKPWYLGAESFEIARENHGLEPDDIFQDVDQSTSDPVGKGVDSTARLVWAGFLVFAPDLEVRDVKKHLSFPPADELMEPINDALGDLSDQQTDGIVGKATGEAG